MKIPTTAPELKKLGIKEIECKILDHRATASGPVTQDEIGCVMATLSIKTNDGEYNINLENDGDGILSVAGQESYAEDYAPLLDSLGVELDEFDNEREKLQEVLGRIGVIEDAQGQFDSYLNEMEVEIIDELYSPGSAYGGVSFRAAKTSEGEIAIQSRNGGQPFRTHGALNAQQWGDWKESCADLSNPAYISRLCDELDAAKEGGAGKIDALIANLSEQESDAETASPNLDADSINAAIAEGMSRYLESETGNGSLPANPGFFANKETGEVTFGSALEHRREIFVNLGKFDEGAFGEIPTLGEVKKGIYDDYVQKTGTLQVWQEQFDEAVSEQSDCESVAQESPKQEINRLISGLQQSAAQNAQVVSRLGHEFEKATDSQPRIFEAERE